MKRFYFTKGFTLIEILISIAVFILIMIAVGLFQRNVFVYNKNASESLQSVEDARTILKVMVRELRTSKPGNNGSYPLLTVASTTLSFYSDIDADGLQEQIRYFLATTTLKKGVIKPAGTPLAYLPANEKFSILANSVRSATSSSLFEYFDNTYAGTSSPLVQPVTIASVRLVKINILIDADLTRPPVARLYTSEVMLRNLKDNL